MPNGHLVKTPILLFCFMLERTLLSLLLLTPSVVFAGATSPQGVWSGTLGTKAIVACFNAESYASYYYADYLRPIALATRDTDSFWHEENDTGLWKLAVPVNGVIVGTWRNPKTKKLLTINLTIVDGNDDKMACARDSYNSRLENTPKVETGKIIQFSPGRSYQKLRFAGQETLKLSGPDPAIDRINLLLKLDQSKDAIQAYFEQRREFLGRVGYPAVDERNTEPTYWDAHFITIRFYVWIAGEGRSGISNNDRTWNTKTGEEVDLWQWILASSSDSRLPPKLKKFLYKNVKASPECSDGYRGQGTFTLTLSKSGLHFDEEAWGDGCENSFFVPYTKSFPFLTLAGKQAVSSIIGKFRGPESN